MDHWNLQLQVAIIFLHKNINGISFLFDLIVPLFKIIYKFCFEKKKFEREKKDVNI